MSSLSLPNLTRDAVLKRITYFETQQQAELWLRDYLQSIMKFANKNGVCAIFDIDGTMLKDRKKEQPLCNKMSSTLYKMCQELHIPIYIITARPEGVTQRKWTIDQLTTCGYPPNSYVELRMMPIAEWKKLETIPNWNFSDYKFKERQRIVKRYNKTIVLNAGDQWTDLTRVSPCGGADEALISDALQSLPNQGVHVGCMIDLSWLSIKLPN